MGQPSNVAAAGGSARASSVTRIREDWRLAREAHKEMLLPGMERTNTLLVGTDAVPMLLNLLNLEQDSTAQWRAGQPLDLPAPGRVRTIILHDVHELTRDEQHQLLRWLGQTAGQIRTISTTGVPLWPLVKQGIFSDVLYYRLNVVYVDVSAPAA